MSKHSRDLTHQLALKDWDGEFVAVLPGGDETRRDFMRKNYIRPNLHYPFRSRDYVGSGSIVGSHSYEYFVETKGAFPKVAMFNGKLHRRCKSCGEFFEDGVYKKCPASPREKVLWKKKALDTAIRRGYFSK